MSIDHEINARRVGREQRESVGSFLVDRLQERQGARVVLAHIGGVAEGIGLAMREIYRLPRFLAVRLGQVRRARGVVAHRAAGGIWVVEIVGRARGAERQQRRGEGYQGRPGDSGAALEVGLAEKFSRADIGGSATEKG